MQQCPTCNNQFKRLVAHTRFCKGLIQVIVPEVIVPEVIVPIIEDIIVPVIEVPTTRSVYEVIECECDEEISFNLSSDSDEEYGSTASSCNDCGSTLVCTRCVGSITTDPVFEEIQIVDTPIMNNLCEI
jgi:hypothetical protein